MNETPRIRQLALACAFGGCLGACDAGDKEEDRKDLEAFAKTALGGETELELKKKEEAVAREEAKAKVEAEKIAAADAERKALDGMAVLPEKLPKKLDDACSEMLDAFTEFTKRSNADDAKNLMLFYDNKRHVLGERRTKCEKVGSIEAAMCQVQILNTAEVPKWKGRELDLMSACVDKFAPEAAKRAAEEDAKGKDPA